MRPKSRSGELSLDPCLYFRYPLASLAWVIPLLECFEFGVEGSYLWVLDLAIAIAIYDPDMKLFIFQIGSHAYR